MAAAIRVQNPSAYQAGIICLADSNEANDALTRLREKLRAYQQGAANVVTAYGAMSYEERMAACDLVESREERRTFRISELVAAHEELKGVA